MKFQKIIQITYYKCHLFKHLKVGHRNKATESFNGMQKATMCKSQRDITNRGSHATLMLPKQKGSVKDATAKDLQQSVQASNKRITMAGRSQIIVICSKTGH